MITRTEQSGRERAGNVLFLTHRIPYPPNKGDKIRSYHMLRYLAERYTVHLGTFVDDPDDRQYVESLNQFCASVCVINLDPRMARLKSLSGLFFGEPLTTGYYRNRTLRKWVEQAQKQYPVKAIVAFSSGVAQFARVGNNRECRRIMDFVDVDSEKWRQYAASSSVMTRCLFSREAKTLQRLERDIANRFDASIFVSPEEADFFRSRVPGARNVHGLSNGVDMNVFDPDAVAANPYADAAPVIVFTGMMDYRANVEGAKWFAEAIFPRIRQQVPQARFYIVGGRPTGVVRSLESLPGVHVTGRVPDIGAFMRYAHVAVAPLRIARGIQNKVLEALAMGTPIVGTPDAFEGIADFPGREEWTADNEAGFAAAVVSVLTERKTVSPVAALRDFVRENYNWDRNLSLLDELIEGHSQPESVSADNARLAQSEG